MPKRFAGLRNLCLVRWNPTMDLVPMTILYGSVLGLLSAATFLVTPERGFRYFLVYGVLAAAIAGVGGPVLWTTLVRRRPVSDLGITVRRWRTSLVLQILFLLPQLPRFLSAVRAADPGSLPALVTLALAIGLFEAVFWRGWILQRLEDSFGVIPALLLSSALYALYHLGYGMGWEEIRFLFFIGLLFAGVFLITRSILILWPLFMPSGQLITVLKEGIRLPPVAAVGFLEVLALMIVIIIAAERRFRMFDTRRNT